MSKLLPRPPAAPLIVFSAAIFASWLGMSRQEPEERHPQPMLNSAEETGPNDLSLNPAEPEPTNATAIAERPLLAKGRRPIAPNSLAESDPTPVIEDEGVMEIQEPTPELVSEPPPEVRLLGVMLASGSRKALMRDHTDESEQWLAIGDTIQGWALVEITQGMVVLRAGADEISIQMFE